MHPLIDLACDLPVLKIIINHPVGETFPANPDAFQDTVAGQLMHDQLGIQNSRLFVGVWHNAPLKEEF